ncbi:hypothetical protein [Lentilactobacillus sp. SPB1-3]|uniref:Uncharacterized protein n=1 Tax=Lentilactobacillus terminaliae TaxID=3003483 RepID=A0ACD5DDK7_9LACO|nr:hypothetical protein [Lentilactobacillus sp. SPB1-3]MCZ0978025.1 hypothetical protein [Lentilactobacillus sp. SPB1-3]
MFKSDYGLVSCRAELRLLEKIDKELEKKRKEKSRKHLPSANQDS